MASENSGRRGFVRKLVKFAALGGLGALVLGERPEKAVAGMSPMDTGDYTWHGGGYAPLVTDNYGAVCGGYNNVAGNINDNYTDAMYAFVGGGQSNRAEGACSAIPGGKRGKALHDGVFLFSDSSGDLDFNSVAANEFAVRCTGGARFVTAINPSTGAPTATISLVDGNRTDGGIKIEGTGMLPSSNFSDLGLRLSNTALGGREWYIDSTGAWSYYGGGKLAFASSIGGTPTMTLTPNSVGIGTTTPDRQLHIRGNNAVARLDRDVDSASFIFTRTALGNYNTVWKTFTFGVKATGVDTGSFFIGDMHTNVGGSSDNRILIDTTGNVGIGTTTPSERLHVAGNVKATGFITGDVTYANGMKTTEEGTGLAFLNDAGEKIAVLDREGNLQVRGKITENPNL